MTLFLLGPCLSTGGQPRCIRLPCRTFSIEAERRRGEVKPRVNVTSATVLIESHPN